MDPFFEKKLNQISEKRIFREIIGWIIYTVGFGIIGMSLIYSYGVFFIGIFSPPQIFKEINNINVDIAKDNIVSTSSISIQNIIQEQIKNIFPQENIVKLLNLIALSIFMGITIWGGLAICEAGYKLTKD